MTLSQRSALKATLMRVAALHPHGVLMYGEDHINEQSFCSHNWLRYNIAADLYCLHLGIAEIDYYMILKDEHLRFFRNKAFYN